MWYFFFQAEDGIRDGRVTGVQTCALPISISHTAFAVAFPALLYVACNALNIGKLAKWFTGKDGLEYVALSAYLLAGLCRSEERRVGKECSSLWASSGKQQRIMF